MFKRKNKTDLIIENKKDIQKNVSDLTFIEDVLINVYKQLDIANEVRELIDDLKYINPIMNDQAVKHHRRINELTEDIKRLFSKYSLEFNEKEFHKLLKKIKIEIYERKNI